MRLITRESVIEQLVCAGKSLPAIAKKMKISERTIQFYLTSILMKYKNYGSSPVRSIARKNHAAV